MSYDNCYIVGYVGPKGSGKSLSMCGALVRKMLRGEKAWSNMPVKTGAAILNRKSYNNSKVEYKETEALNWDLLYKLDESMVEGTVAIDEITYYASSRQSMDTRNRLINTCCRQARHRSLNFLYTARAFGWVDSYLRAETDIIITCDDLSYSGWGRDNTVKGGTVIRQRYYDLSGLATGKPQDFFSGKANPYKVVKFYGTPYWDCYDTKEIISIEEAFTGVKLNLKKRYIGNEDQENAHINTEIAIAAKVAELKENNVSLTSSKFKALLKDMGLSYTPRVKDIFSSYGYGWDTYSQNFSGEETLTPLSGQRLNIGYRKTNTKKK